MGAAACQSRFLVTPDPSEPSNCLLALHVILCGNVAACASRSVQPTTSLETGVQRRRIFRPSPGLLAEQMPTQHPGRHRCYPVIVAELRQAQPVEQLNCR